MGKPTYARREKTRERDEPEEAEMTKPKSEEETVLNTRDFLFHCRWQEPICGHKEMDGRMDEWENIPSESQKVQLKETVSTVNVGSETS
jgi:hypothetical protein